MVRRSHRRRRRRHDEIWCAFGLVPPDTFVRIDRDIPSTSCYAGNHFFR